MRSVVVVCLAIALLVGVAQGPVQAAERPDIVVLMLDDIPPDGLARVIDRLPRMRRLFVERGLQFSHFYGNDPLCCPGRANFLTGLTSSHHGLRIDNPRKLRASMTIATALDKVGYHTMMVGKYLNNAGRLLDDHTPPGWDRVSMMSDGAYYGYDLYVNGVREHHGSRATDYSTDVIRRDALRSLRRAPAGDPLFLYLAPFAVHDTVVDGRQHYALPAPRHRSDERCDGVGYRRTPAYDEADVSDKPLWIQRLDYTQDPLYHPLGYPLGPVCRALLSVDELMAAVTAELREQGRFNDTLFVLTADNGMGWGDHRRRAKRVPWATPIPLYVRWPAVLGSTPGRIGAWAQNIDLAPTLAEVAGATLGPYPTGQAAPDGISLLDLARSRGADVPTRRALFEEHRDPPGSPLTWISLRTTRQHPLGLWHYTRWVSGEAELYDLAADPWELTNVARRYPSIAATLNAELLARAAE